MIGYNADGKLLIKMRERKFINQSVTNAIEDLLFNWNQFIKMIIQMNERVYIFISWLANENIIERD